MPLGEDTFIVGEIKLGVYLELEAWQELFNLRIRVLIGTKKIWNTTLLENYVQIKGLPKIFFLDEYWYSLKVIDYENTNCVEKLMFRYLSNKDDTDDASTDN